MKLLMISGEPYVAVELEDARGWFVWKLKLCSEVYHVGPHGCTCPAPGVCKHQKALAAKPTPKDRDRRHSRG